MADNQILLYRNPQGWMAWHKGPHAKEIVDLFGTDTLPTAWTDKADGETVRREIAERNPGVSVKVRVGNYWV